MKKVILILIVALIAFSCNKTAKKEIKDVAKKEMAAVYKSLEVVFEAKKGQFTYDINKLSKEDIVNKINGIAGDDLYLVTKTTDLEQIIEKSN